MKILIIEDEPIAANRLEARLQEISDEYQILAKIGSIKDSVKWLRKHTADLIFLDIQLSDGLSFAIFDQVELNTPIIFTTAYDQYAIKAFELNSVAYLLKPIRKNELEQGIKKYESMRSAYSVDFEKLLMDYQKKTTDDKKRFLVKLGEKYVRLDVTDIAYFFSMNKDVYAKSFSDRNYPLDYTLDALERQLSSQTFFRINRQYIVNIEAIKNMIGLSRTRIKLELNPKPVDGPDPIVSIQHSSDFKKWMNI